MSGTLLEAPTDFNTFDLTEWLELTMVIDEVDLISRASILSFFPAGQGPDSAELDQLFAEVRRRASSAPAIYPFVDQGDEILFDRSIDSRAYLALLVMSIDSAPYRVEDRFNEINPDFELLTREAMTAYAGPGAKGLRFGWPNDDGRPQYLGDAVEWLANRLGLAVGVVHDEVDSTDKDGGIDVVAWKPFMDGSPSFSVWLVQCTVQATYERKPADVVPEKWVAWIRFGRQPEIVLSVPQAIPLDAKIRDDLKYRANVVLDRIRLCELLNNVSDLSQHEEWAHLLDWTNAEILMTRAALSASGGAAPRRQKIRRPLRPRKASEPLV